MGEAKRRRGPLRGGKVVRFEWSNDRDEALRAARLVAEAD
jgi:hypothetical protein